VVTATVDVVAGAWVDGGAELGGFVSGGLVSGGLVASVATVSDADGTDPATSASSVPLHAVITSAAMATTTN